MIHVLTNALALAPAAANARPSQQVSNLQTIITQVEHFYGEGWHTILWEVGLIAALLGVIAPMLIYLIEWKTFHKKIKKAQRKAHDETEDAKRQTAEVRKEASESIKQQQTAMTALIKQEANKAKNSTTALVLKLTAANISGEYGTPVTSPNQLQGAIQLYFFSMCYASLAGDDVQCQIGKVQLANTFGRLQDMKPDFNGGEFATRLEDLRRALLELREPRNDACEGLIREALEGIRQPSMSQK